MATENDFENITLARWGRIQEAAGAKGVNLVGLSGEIDKMGVKGTYNFNPDPKTGIGEVVLNITKVPFWLSEAEVMQEILVFVEGVQ